MPFRDKRVACIGCDGTLTDFNAVGCHFLRCNRCKGAWVTHTMLERLCGLMRPNAVVEFVLRASTATDGSNTPSCVSCDVVLSGRYIEEIHVDVCDAHGVWFDEDELQIVLLRISGEASPL